MSRNIGLLLLYPDFGLRIWGSGQSGGTSADAMFIVVCMPMSMYTRTGRCLNF